MHFKEIYIDNFKTLKNVRIHLDKELSVFTGTNNAGKTTVLEALALWCECFRTLVTQAKKADSKNSIRQGDYRLGTKSSNYIDYRSITSIRTSKYEDIFHEMDVSNKILISIKVVGDDFELDIPIKIKAANGGNYLISLDEHDNFDFITFNSKLSLPTPFTAIYASPVAALVSEEKYVTAPQVTQQILSRRSFLVLRNRISKLKTNPNYQNFEDDISYVLFEQSQSVRFEVIGDIHKDVKVNVNVYFGNQSTAKDISLLGSGTLQIIELMLAIHEERSDLNLIMLDEPDSHIHRDIQKRLIQVLARNSLKAQVFLTTHNESLIRATKPKNIFHINNSGTSQSELNIKAIQHSAPETLKAGIQPSGKSKVIKALGNSDSLDILDCLEAKKIIFVEGEDDALYIRSIYEKIKNKSLDDCVFWSLNGLDTFIDCINHYQSFFKIIANGHNLWEKSVAIIDADFITESQREKLTKQIDDKLNLPNYVWSEYTIESSIIRNSSILAKLINRISIKEGHSLSPQLIRTTVEQEIKELSQVKLKLINEDENFQRKIAGQIKNRNQKWKECADINIFQGGEQNFLIDYQSFSRPLLNENNCAHIANKDDLSQLLDDILTKLGICVDYSPLSPFEYLISYYDNSLSIESWNNLAEFLEN